MATDLPADLRHGDAELPGVRLHYVEAGTGPLVVLLHGFPEFWFAWRAQITALAAAGYRVVAPDLRGYNTSSKPSRVSDYTAQRLAGDVRALIAERGEQQAMVVGHDWGGVVAWTTAFEHPGAVARLAILDMPHPRRMLEGLRTLRQLRRSWYVFAFQPPGLPERLIARDRWAALRAPLEQDARPGALSPADIDRYVQAWSQPGAATGMLNYYRAAFRRAPWRAAADIRPVTAPTLVIWGERDRHLGVELAEPHTADVPRLERVVRLDASHWVHHDEPETVSRLLAEFFAAG
jgi:pimeloyl-ACP methyl ester carboxylesterase